MRIIRDDQYALFFLVLWILWTLFSIFNFYLFFKNKTSIYIRNRDPWLIFSSALGQYCMMTTLTWEIILLPENFPTMVDLYFLWVFIPLHFLPYPVRSMRFIIQYAYNKYQYKQMRKNDQEAKNKFLDFLQKHPIFRQDKTYLILNWVLMAIAIIWGITRNVKYPENHPGHRGLDHSRTYYVSCTVLLIVASVLVWIAVHFLLKTGEDLYVTPELIAIGLLWLIFISLYIVFGWAEIGSFRIGPIFIIILCISSFCISFGMPIQMAVAIKKYEYKEEDEEEEESHPKENKDTTKSESILDNDENAFNSQKKEIEKPTIKNENKEEIFDNKEIVKKYKSLQGVIDDKDSYELLRQFCEKKMCPEFLYFLKDVSIYKNSSDEELPAKFKELKENYVKDDARFHINIQVAVLRKIENTEQPDRKTFEDMIKKVNYMIMTEIFPPFKRSDAMVKFVEDKIQEAKKEFYRERGINYEENQA